MADIKELREEELEKVNGGKTIPGADQYSGIRGGTTPTAPTNTKIYDENMADSSANPLHPWETIKTGYCKSCESNQELLFTYRTTAGGKSCNVWVCQKCDAENYYSQSVGELM